MVQPLMKIIENSVEISLPPSNVLDYVTRPARWHEWFPSSKKSEIEDEVMKLGDTFSIVTIQKPLNGLLPRIEKSIDWKVVEYEEASTWRITSSSPSIDLDTKYQLTHTEFGTLFQRRFRYKPKGILRVIEPIALRKGLIDHANIALSNLKTVLEKNA